MPRARLRSACSMLFMFFYAYGYVIRRIIQTVVRRSLCCPYKGMRCLMEYLVASLLNVDWSARSGRYRTNVSCNEVILS